MGGASGLGPRKALFDRWLLGFKFLQEEEEDGFFKIGS